MLGNDDDAIVETVTITYERTVVRGMQGLNSPANLWNEPLPPQESDLKALIRDVSAQLIATAIWGAGATGIGFMVGWFW